MGWDSPLGVPSPSGDLIAYNAWEKYHELDPAEPPSAQGVEPGDPIARPSIRLLNTDTHEDTLLEDGAFSIAWNPDGRLAYFKGLEPDVQLNEEYEGHIVVRDDVSTPPVPWTVEPATYSVAAWATEGLIAYADHEGGSHDLLLLRGPGDTSTLSPNSEFIALSPDGTRALVDFEQPNGTSIARMIDLESGEVISEVDLSQQSDPETSEPFSYLGYSGSWAGNFAVVPSSPGLLIFDTSQDALTLHGILRFGDRFPFGVTEPQFVDGSEDRVIAAAPVPGEGGEARGILHTYLDCDLISFECVVGRPRGEVNFHPVYNPSRV